MNQDFSASKKCNICLKKKKIRAEGFTWKRNSCTRQWAKKKNSCKLKIPPPHPHHFSNGPSLKCQFFINKKDSVCIKIYYKQLFTLLQLQFATLATRRKLEPKCVPRWFLGWALWRTAQLLANFFYLSLVTIPDIFAKVNSALFPYPMSVWRTATKHGVCYTPGHPS